MNAPSAAPAPPPGPIRVRAAGCVVWRPGSTGPQVAVIHRPRYDDWSFPKGKLDPGETWLVAALREVLEETGYPVLVGRRLPTQEYDVSYGGPARVKRVKYWAARATADTEFVPNREVDRLEWVPVAQARALLTRQTDQDLLEAFAAAPVDTVPVILLRHGEALPRKRWDGTEPERPLTERGRGEAEALVPALAAYGEASLVSSPLARCVETLLPASRAFDVEIGRERGLAEDAEPESARSWLRQALKAGRPVVACTHRPVLPELLGETPLGQAVRAGRRALAPGEAWVLHGRDGAVVAIDRLKV